MKKLNFIFLCIAVICTCAMLMSSFSVYGSWIYYADTVPFGYTVLKKMGEFEYAPEEVLPGGSESNQEVELGGNHFALIDLILNEKDKGYGLNINNSVIIHQYLKKQSVVYSNQKVSGGNLKFILDPKNNTHGLYYCVQKVTDTEYNVYTFSFYDMDQAKGTNTEIQVYKTVLVKTNKWNATKSYIGYAKVRTLTTLGVSADPNTIPYSVDIATWRT